MKKISLFTLFLSLFMVLGACNKTKDTNKPLTQLEQFNIATKPAQDNYEELKSIFGKNTSYEVGGVPVGSKKTNEYELILKLEQVSPMTQQSFDEIKVKIRPYSDKILNKMKAVGIKHPVLNLRILDKNGNPFEGSEHLVTTFSLTP
ncbi:hypothetical protein OGZ51_10375 [Lactococcus lactis]|uniref:Lipoprotein n=1 Tax=Lactococcus lactis TaxID=1358 RepID=A0A9X4NI91_9LACT|nr:hypothetical protein [Lactococcus lactis]MDG4984550.1 hypothetical protein [Lactococcus lactis]